MLLVLHEAQAQDFCWDMLGCVGRPPSLGRCWPLSLQGRAKYVQAYGTRQAVPALGVLERARRQQVLAEMEETMSFCEIVYLRRDVRGWDLPPQLPTHQTHADRMALSDSDVADSEGLCRQSVCGPTEGGDWSLDGDPLDPRAAHNALLAGHVVLYIGS